MGGSYKFPSVMFRIFLRRTLRDGRRDLGSVAALSERTLWPTGNASVEVLRGIPPDVLKVILQEAMLSVFLSGSWRFQCFSVEQRSWRRSEAMLV